MAGVTLSQHRACCSRNRSLLPSRATGMLTLKGCQAAAFAGALQLRSRRPAGTPLCLAASSSGSESEGEGGTGAGGTHSLGPPAKTEDIKRPVNKRGFFHLLKDPAASQRIEKKWTELKRKRQRTFASAVRNLKASWLGQSARGLLDFIWDLLYPVRVVWYYIHKAAYEVSLIYNDFCLREAQLEWRWSNYTQPEHDWWAGVMDYVRGMFYTSFYLFLTPAAYVWTLVLPIAFSFCAFDAWWRSPVIAAMLVFLPAKFPPGFEPTLFGFA